MLFRSVRFLVAKEKDRVRRFVTMLKQLPRPVSGYLLIVAKDENLLAESAVKEYAGRQGRRLAFLVCRARPIMEPEGGCLVDVNSQAIKRE